VNPILAATLSAVERAYPVIYRNETFVTESSPPSRRLIYWVRTTSSSGQGRRPSYPRSCTSGMRRYKKPRDARGR